MRAVVAYSFQPRFALPIQQGLKRQTVRGARLRHARPGEKLQLYTGMRTAACARIVPDVTCTAARPVVLVFGDGALVDVRIEWWRMDPGVFARGDGFADAADIFAFWRERNGLRPGDSFYGTMIEWRWPPEQSHDS